jgi:AcrR family transcriptional regulator
MLEFTFNTVKCIEFMTRRDRPHRAAPARAYVSPTRRAQASATRAAILRAFVEQMREPARQSLSPAEAARTAGVSVRTVHLHFPNLESQITAVGEWCDQQIYSAGPVQVAQGPDDLPRYFRDVHAAALASPYTRALSLMLLKWPQIRQHRRAARLDAIRKAVADIGAPADATRDATAQLLALSGLDASWPMHELYGLPLERIPHVIANTVQLIVEQLKSSARRRTRPRA